MTTDALGGGFGDRVMQAQSVFRAVLTAMSRPGLQLDLNPDVRPPRPLSAVAAAILCTFADEDTPVFLDRQLSGHDSVAAWIRFHTGARMVARAGEADFAVIADPEQMPPLERFRAGTDAYPDRSATVILQVESLAGPTELVLHGPGIDGTACLRPHPLPADFAEQLCRNRLLFPRGVDLVFAAPGALAALPRSSRLAECG